MSARRCRLLLVVAVAALAGLAAQCGTTAAEAAAQSRSAKAFAIVYQVLQHPRCVNCHPFGNAPLQGDEGRPHAQNVQRGPCGDGMFAMRCQTCHQTHNLPGEHLPPGAPNWELPAPQMPLVFQGKSMAELARQLADPKLNGNRTPQMLLEHVTSDRLVLWGWDPGPGRTPVSVPHAKFVAAIKEWIDGGCAVPDSP
jgi:hypothetical protein